MTEESFVQAIRDEPEAREHYLVFADWLDEQGEAARAQMIRVALELERLHNDPRRVELAEQGLKLQKEIESSWPVCQAWGKVGTLLWDRGLPSSVWMGGDWPGVRAVRALPPFPYLRELSCRELPTPLIAELLFERTADLTIRFEFRRLDFAALRAYPGLKGLSLYDEGRLTDDDLAHLAPLKDLRTLRLMAAGITDAGWYICGTYVTSNV